MSRGDLSLSVVCLQVGGVHVARTSFRFCCPFAARGAARQPVHSAPVRGRRPVGARMVKGTPAPHWPTRRAGGPRRALPRGGCGTRSHALVATLDAVAAREPGAPRGRSFLVGGGVTDLVLWLYGLVIDQTSSANFVPVNTADNCRRRPLSTGPATGRLLTGATGRPGRAAVGGEP